MNPCLSKNDTIMFYKYLNMDTVVEHIKRVLEIILKKFIVLKVI
jgi:hypothetical protein